MTPLEPALHSPGDDLSVGTGIEVRDRFCASWSHGFEIAERTPDGYRVLRVSDRYVLPSEFVAGDVRRPT
jgi:hypothetical protein